MTETPFCSIIVPTCDRPLQLAETLESLARLDYPRDRFEVLVVQDGDAVHLDPIVESFRDRLSLSLLQQPHAGPAAARNAGASRARGDLLVFTDDDCRPRAGWLRAIVDPLAAASDRVVGGQTVNGLADNVYSAASQLLVDYLYRYYNADAQRARFLTSNNLAVPAAPFRAVGGFDRRFRYAAAEDRDFCDRWLRAGYTMAHTAGAVVEHEHAMSLGSFWRQHFMYGRGAFAFHRARARRGGVGVSVEPFSFYVDLLRFAFTAAGGLAGLRLVMLMVVSQVANAAGFAAGPILDRRP